MKLKWILACFGLAFGSVILWHGAPAFLSFVACAYLFIIMPGYMAIRLTPLKKILTPLYQLALSLPLAFALYVVPLTPLSFLGSRWDTVTLVLAILYGLLWLAYMIFDRANLDFPGLGAKLRSAFDSDKRGATLTVLACVALVAVVVVGTRYTDIYEDCTYHLTRINQLMHADHVDNFYYLTSWDPFNELVNTAQSGNRYQALPKDSTYDFGFYFIVIAFFARTCGLSAAVFSYYLQALLFPCAILILCFLGWTLIKDKRLQPIIVAVTVLSFIVLKNYFNVSRLGPPAFLYTKLFIPTTISSTIFMPAVLGLISLYQFGEEDKRNKRSLLVCIIFLSIACFCIHKIGMIFLLCWVPAMYILNAIVMRDIRSGARLLKAFGVLVAIVGVYGIYWVISRYPEKISYIANVFTNAFKKNTAAVPLPAAPSVSGNYSASLTESSAVAYAKAETASRFVFVYGSYLENTWYKLLYFPLSLFAIIGGSLVIGKTNRKHPAYILLVAGILSFVLITLPGMNLLVMKYLRAFVQRCFGFLSVELLCAVILYKLTEKESPRRFIKYFLMIVALSTCFTIVFDVYRKGNQTYRWYGLDRYAFSQYIERTFPNNSRYIADFNTEIEMSTTSKLLSSTFNSQQYLMVRKGEDTYSFQRRLNEFIYSGAERDAFLSQMKKNGINYVIIGKKSYAEETLSLLGPGIFNPKFADFWKTVPGCTNVYEDNFHVIFQIAM
jgi:hypothetical protein